MSTPNVLKSTLIIENNEKSNGDNIIHMNGSNSQLLSSSSSGAHNENIDIDENYEEGSEEDDEEEVEDEFEDYSNSEVDEVDSYDSSSANNHASNRSTFNPAISQFGEKLTDTIKTNTKKAKAVAENIIHNLKRINIHKKRRVKKKRVGFAGGSNATESFSIDIGMMWLLKSIERSTIQKHVCERILKLPHRDFQFYLPQIIHVCVVYNSEPIITMLLEKCKLSIIIAAQTYFLLQATVHDNYQSTYENAKLLWRRCEAATLGILDDSTSFNSNITEVQRESVQLSDNSIIINEQYWDDEIIQQQQRELQQQQNLQQSSSSNNNNNNNSNSNPLLSSSSRIPVNSILTQFNDDLTYELQQHQQDNMKVNSSRDNLKRLSFSTSELTQLHQGSTLSKHLEKPIMASLSKNPYDFFFDLLEYEIDVEVPIDDNNSQPIKTELIDQSKPVSINPGPNNSKDISSSQSSPNSSSPSSLKNSKIIKKKRYNYQPFYSELLLVNILSKVGSYLLSIPLVTDRNQLKEMRNAALRGVLKQLNEQLFSDNNSILLPVYPPFLVLGICYEEALCLNSRERVPFLVVLEVKRSSDTQLYQDPNQEDLQKGRVVDINSDSDEDMDDETKKEVSEWVEIRDGAQSTLDLVFGERWKSKESRIWKNSQKSSIDGWSLISFIIKSGDDLRQESLAMQIITQFYRIFKRANLPLWLRPYLVIATGFDSGIIETVPDSTSLDNLKKRDPQFTTLKDYFIRAYGDEKTITFQKAQSNFIESLAAYSLVCYFLQIKDRHNGNILIDTVGHIVHIDYGFIMSSSPGSMNWEKAPFKLTKDFLELMGGIESDRFTFFKHLLIGGFIEVRKHSQEFLMMIELLLPHTSLSCILKNGEYAISEFKNRFKLELNDDQCVKFIEELIEQSVNSWSTSTYDTYQKLTNGISV